MTRQRAMICPHLLSIDQSSSRFKLESLLIVKQMNPLFLDRISYTRIVYRRRERYQLLPSRSSLTGTPGKISRYFFRFSSHKTNLGCSEFSNFIRLRHPVILYRKTFAIAQKDFLEDGRHVDLLS